MINIKLSESSSKKLYAEIQNKVEGMKELNTIKTKNQIVSSEFSMSAIKFVKTTNLLAKSAKKYFHHVYDWGGVGSETSRLFRIVKTQESSGTASIYYKFNNSRKRAPIAKELTMPGVNGKRVTRSGIFKRKAEVMEDGGSANFVTSRYIAFSPKGGGIVFIPPGKSITIKNPGGKETTGSFDKHFKSWWIANFGKSLEQAGAYIKIEKNVARALSKKGAGKSAARDAIASTLKQYQTIGSVI